LHGKYTLFAEGARGQLGKELIARYDLAAGATAQHYGIGIKELWQVDPAKHKPGLVVHGAGWPLSEHGATGGSFLYHMEDNQVVVGLIADLNYANPYLSPFEEFQRFKSQAEIRPYLEGGKRLCYGARAITKGGLNSLPKQTFPGGLLLGCDAGTLNFAKIKGIHTAMKSGMLAAETVGAALQAGDPGRSDLVAYEQAFRDSWLYAELHQARNFGPALHKFGTFLGGAFNWIQQNLFGGRMFFTLKDRTSDHEQLAACRALPAHPVSQAGRRSDLRSAVVGVHVQYGARGRPAGAPATARQQQGHLRSISRNTLRRNNVTARRGVRNRRGSQRPAPADQRLELRALQDLRYQGSDAEHPLGGTRGWRRAQLSQHVSELATCPSLGGARWSCFGSGRDA
jgi:hypothetical protein